MTNLSLKDTTSYLIYLVSILVALYLTWFLTPFLIGPWESFHLFNSFYEIEGPKVVMSIQRGANTAGHYGRDNYGIINLWAYLIQLSNFSLTLFNIRFLSIISGLISSYLFFRLSHRWFGRHIALVITLLLSINETFLLFEHYLLPQMFTFCSMLFCLEMFVSLYQDQKEDFKISTSIALGLAGAFCAMNYLLSRLFLIFIFLLQLKMIFTGKNILKLSPETKKINFKKAAITWISYLIFLGILKPENVIYTFYKKFIFSDLGEYATSSSSFIDNFIYNFPFLIKHVLLDFTFIKDSLPFFVLGDAKYHLTTWPFSLFALMGLIVSIIRFREFKNLLILSIFSMMLLILNMSYVYDTFPGGGRTTTLSSFRSFYFILPLFLLIGVFYQYLLDKLHQRFKNYHPIFDLVLIFVPLFLFSVNVNLKSMRKFQTFYDSQQFDFKLDAPKKDFTEKEVKDQTFWSYHLLEIQEGVYYLNQVYMRKLADRIIDKMRNHPDSDSRHFLVNLPLKKYTPAHYKLCCSLRDRPYLKIFLSIYLFDSGVRNTYLDDTRRYRFQDPVLYISTNEQELFKIRKDYPDLTLLGVEQ